MRTTNAIITPSHQLYHDVPTGFMAQEASLTSRCRVNSEGGGHALDRRLERTSKPKQILVPPSVTSAALVEGCDEEGDVGPRSA